MIVNTEDQVVRLVTLGSLRSLASKTCKGAKHNVTTECVLWCLIQNKPGRLECKQELNLRG